MPTYDQWRTTDEAEEKACAASDRCSDFVVAEVAAFPATLSPWREDEEPPGEKEPPLAQYRYWLFEQEREDSPANRQLFLGVLYGWEMDKWELGTSVEWD